MLRSIPQVDRLFDFFLLPDCFLQVIKLKECNKPRWRIALDMLNLFFCYKIYPDNYGPCRLWEVKNIYWKYYYGSNYRSYQRSKLQREVQPREYAILFDDKAICLRLCRELGITVPKTHGIISPSQNYIKKIHTWLSTTKADSLIIKPLRGSAGRGIVLANRINENIFIQNKEGLIPLQSFNLDEEAIVQDVVNQDARLSEYSSFSLNTMRIVTMYTKSAKVIVLAASIRFGVDNSFVDNVSAGGIAVKINPDTGELENYAIDKRGKRYFKHPTTKRVFEGFLIPEWTRIRDVAERTQQSFSCYRILGMDIALNENADPVLIEINDAPDLLGMEFTCGPLLKIKENLIAFGDYDLLVNRYQKNLYKNLITS